MDNRNKITELEKELRIWKTEEYTEKENSKRIEKLEKDAKDHDLYQQDQYDIIKQELSELKTKIKDIKLGNTAKILNQNKIVADYAELKASSASHTEEMNKRTDHLHDEIHELKESLKALGGFSNEHAYDIANQEEVLRDMLENKKKNAEQHIAELVNEPEIEERFITACRKQIEDAKRQLKKLGGGKTVSKDNEPSLDVEVLNGKTDSKPPRVDIYQYKGKLPHYENMDPAYHRNPSEQDPGSARQTEKNDDIWAFECPICGFLASNIPVKKVDFTKPWSVKVLVKKEELEWWCRDTRGPIHDSMKKYLEEDKE